jgi:D-galactose 1-dehydrogenase
MLSTNQVDAVLIATPPSDHFTLAMQALDARRHVLVEKPPARTSAQAIALHEKARGFDRTLFFAYHAAYNPAIEWLRRQVSADDISFIRIDYKENVRNFHPAGSWVIQEGVLRDSGINAVSLLTSLVRGGRLVVTTAKLDKPTEREAEVRAQFDCSFDRGTAHVSLDWEHRGDEQRTVLVTTALDTYQADISHGTVDKDGRREFSAVAADGMLHAEYAQMIGAFASAIEQRRCMASPAELRVLDDVYQRAENT